MNVSTEIGRMFDNFACSVRKESNDTYRKKWEILCGNRLQNLLMNGRKFLSSSEVPSSADRIPNPFGRLVFNPKNNFAALVINSVYFYYCCAAPWDLIFLIGIGLQLLFLRN